MASPVSSWIKDMKKRAAVAMNPSGLLPVKPIMPSAMRYGLQNDINTPGSAPVSDNLGSRFTGAATGNTNNPAGIVHEKEMVMEAPLVEKLGGSQMARAKLEELASNATGFASGTGDSTAGDIVNNNTTRGSDIDYTKLTKQGISAVKDIASGKSEALDKVAQASRNTLAASQAAGEMATRSRMSQAGMEGGAAEAVIGTTQKQAGVERGKLESDIQIEKAWASETAGQSLVDIGMKGQQFEEDVRQFDVLQNWNKSQSAITAALAAGDYDTAAIIFKDNGFSVDFSKAKDADSQQAITTGMARLMVSGKTATSSTDDVFTNDARVAWEGMNGKGFTGKNSAGQTFDEWKQEQYDIVKAQNDPFTGIYSTVTDDSLISMFGNLDDITYTTPGGTTFTGRKAALAIMAGQSQVGQGMQMNADGSITMNTDWWTKNVPGSIVTPTAPVIGEADEGVFTPEQVASVGAGGVLSSEDGTLYEKSTGKDGKMVKIDTNTDSRFKDKTEVKIGKNTYYRNPETNTWSTEKSLATWRTKDKFKGVDFDDKEPGDVVPSGGKKYYVPLDGKSEPVEIHVTTFSSTGTATISNQGKVNSESGGLVKVSIGQIINVTNGNNDIKEANRDMPLGVYRVIGKNQYENIETGEKFPTDEEIEEMKKKTKKRDLSPTIDTGSG